MKFPILPMAAIAGLFAAASAASAATVIAPSQSVMTSSFFMGANTVRGYAVDNRPVFRVSTNAPFELSGAETIYLSFAFNPADYTAPVSSAILGLTSVAGGQGADATPENPFLVSAHGVNLNPFTAITDDTNPTGTVSWLSFYNNNILAADPAASTSINGFGAFNFDITGIFNSWIDGTNTNYVVALTGKNDTSGEDFLHGFANNTAQPGSTTLTVVPEPGSFILLGLSGCLLASRRRLRKA